ncbi:hypothetical protein PUN28_001972 [Cardiocondyla obscurior]|uniref:Secreted protein n=1 Tax=Cardiocondyla obscurior TaxID=286306 RepID=A0AAW2GRX9_9HYME
MLRVILCENCSCKRTHLALSVYTCLSLLPARVIHGSSASRILYIILKSRADDRSRRFRYYACCRLFSSCRYFGGCLRNMSTGLTTGSRNAYFVKSYENLREKKIKKMKERRNLCMNRTRS